MPLCTNGLLERDVCSDGLHISGKNGVIGVFAAGDGSVEYIRFAEGQDLAYVRSASGYPAYYPVPQVQPERPVRYVLMDLDGTTVKSEPFWIWMIELVVQDLTGNRHFSFEAADLPHISGHSVTEHLSYCIGKYCPGVAVEEARQRYFFHTRREMREVLEGRGRRDAFVMAPGAKEFLLELKGQGMKLGLVTSGLYEKAYPEIYAAFTANGMGSPEDFYDCIITAGAPLGQGACGTLGELSPKPHPWLYAEAGCVGLGILPEERGRVLAIEDSAAGVHSILLAGYPCCGISGGNIEQSGVIGLCDYYCSSFEEIMAQAIGGKEHCNEISTGF